MEIVGDMEGHAGVVAQVRHPRRALAADDEEPSRLPFERVPPRRDVRPAVARDRGDPRVPGLGQEAVELVLGETADVVARLEPHSKTRRGALPPFRTSQKMLPCTRAISPPI